MKSRIVACTLLLLSIPGVASAWWNDDWGFRKKITLDTTAATGADIKGSPTEVPVLIRLHTGNFRYFVDAQANGGDIRFIASDDKTPLKHHIEKFDAINEMALIWVQVPAISGSNNTQSIWMYYGNAAATDASDAAGTYDTPQALVYHFSEKETPRDATAYGNQPTLFTAKNQSASLIGAGLTFQGNGIVNIPPQPSLHLSANTGWTFSSWLKFDAPQKDAYLMQRRDGGNELTLAIDGTAVYARLQAGSTIETPKSTQLTPGRWHHLALTIGSGRMSIVIDGVEAATTPIPALEMDGPVSVGTTADGTHFYVGELDELQISATARVNDWLRAAAANQGADSKLLAYGEDEQFGASSTGGTSYIGTIMHNLTTDGWVVIGMLVIMFFISIAIMTGKALTLRRVQTDNRSFMAKFRGLSADETDKLDRDETADEQELEASPLAGALFGKHDHFQSSTLYHLYHAAVQETHHRVGKSVGAKAASISPTAMNAIRATVDATYVRESQRINRNMVLLTIAVSGGPLIGLLGTVLGVMITFAEIAASGNVDVNAIAPGVAAALAATVAGLAVAIPSMFGYNYLMSQIRELQAEMRVFVDELLTKIGETYS